MNTNENTTPAPKRKRHDEAFQRSTVEHWMLSGKSARQTASELGITAQTLQNWRKKFRALPAGAVAGTLEQLQAENRRLQKELHYEASSLFLRVVRALTSSSLPRD